MAKIFDIRGGSQVPSLSQAIAPTLDIPVMDFDTIASALDSYSTYEENDIANAEENFNSLTEFHDQLIGEKFDTERQRDVFEKARKDVGIGDDAFRLSLDDLRDSYKVRSVRSKVGQIYDRADVKEIFFEQQRSKDYLDKIYNLKDMNPNLYKKALSKYNKYRNGEISGFDLLPQEFTPIDVTSTIAESLKLVPQIETSDIETKHGLAYEKIIKERSREAIDSVINRLNSNAAFKNNLEAMFTDESGVYDKEAADDYVDQLASEYAKQYIDIENVKEISSVKPKDQPLQNVMDDVIRMGGDANELMKNKTLLQQAVEAKKVVKIDEDEDNVYVSYLKPDDEEDVITIPKTGVSTSGPTTYNMSIGGETKSLTNDDIKSYIEENPKVAYKGFFGVKSLNEGQKTEGYLRDGNFYTNDINMLYELGLVPKGTDFEDLEEHGFKVTETEDGKYLAEIPVTSNKVNVNVQQEVYVPNRATIESKLDSNPIIKNYPKNSDKYVYATMFLASPEIQDGYFKDVYLREDYQNYLNSVTSVAPLQDNGFFDISDVHKDIKPLIEKNTEEKLMYLAHHHANRSGGLLKFGKTKISGNPHADSDVKAVWKRIDKILEKTPGLDFFELLKKVESDNSYDAVYTGDVDSSAIGKYQILFDTHYDKIKKYIEENIDKVPTDVGDSEDKTVKESDTTTTASPIFDDFKN